jgi:hypothetical protein
VRGRERRWASSGGVDLKVGAGSYARGWPNSIHLFPVNVAGRPSPIVVVVYEYEASLERGSPRR